MAFSNGVSHGELPAYRHHVMDSAVMLTGNKQRTSPLRMTHGFASFFDLVDASATAMQKRDSSVYHNASHRSLHVVADTHNAELVP